MEKNKYGFVPEICECCSQGKTYLLPIDWGTVLIVKSVAAAIRRKGINFVHPKKEMEVSAKDWRYERAVSEGVLTSNQIGNFTRARVHGLIARHHSEPGNWLLTSKGASFLRGERIPKLAIIEKSRKVDGGRSHKQDYFKPEEFTCTVNEFGEKGIPFDVWEGIDFVIKEGRIVLDIENKELQTTSSLF